MVLKNKIVRVVANTYGDLFVHVYENTKGQEVVGTYKFDGCIGGVDLEVGIPKGKRKEYAKIIKLK